MQKIRSFLAKPVFYGVFVFGMLICSPILLMPSKLVSSAFRWWTRMALFLTRVFGGVKLAVTGREHLPPESYLVASKHQSAWETLGFSVVFKDPVFVLKRELTRIPLFGLYLRALEMISIDRSKGTRSLREMLRETKDRAAKGRPIVIFPEGTRCPPGVPTEYKQGIYQIYRALNLPCVPVALNTGLFWPGRGKPGYPGTIRVSILEPIPPGLEREDFMDRLQDVIEKESARLIELSAKENPALPSLPRNTGATVPA